MAKFKRVIVTDRGRALLAKVLTSSNKNIEFTKMAVSSKEYSDEELKVMTTLNQEMQATTITEVKIMNQSAVQVEGAIHNTNLLTGYYAKTLVLYANDPDLGEIIYAGVGTEVAGYIPAFDGVASTGMYLKMNINVSNSDKVMVSCDVAAVATMGEILELRAGKVDKGIRKANTSEGVRSTVLGNNNTASGTNSYAEGNNTTSSNESSHAEGFETQSKGQSSHAEGYKCKAFSHYSHAEGYNTTAGASTTDPLLGNSCHAEGRNTTASGSSSHSEGYATQSKGIASHAEGHECKAYSNHSHAEGYDTVAGASATDPNLGNSCHAEGRKTVASGSSSHAEGFGGESRGIASHKEGNNTYAYANHSHAEGYQTRVGILSETDTVTGECGHAEGSNTIAIGRSSHAEGYATQATESCSHAEGNTSIASGDCAHAEGNNTIASGNNSHAQGYNTEAKGDKSHASGEESMAIKNLSFTHGLGVTTESSLYDVNENQSSNTSITDIITSFAINTVIVDVSTLNFNSGDIVFVKPNKVLSSSLLMGTVSKDTSQAQIEFSTSISNANDFFKNGEVTVYASVTNSQNDKTIGARDIPRFAMGRYNKPFKKNEVFKIGCGVSDSGREDLLVLTVDGKLIIKGKEVYLTN